MFYLHVVELDCSVKSKGGPKAPQYYLPYLKLHDPFPIDEGNEEGKNDEESDRDITPVLTDHLDSWTDWLSFYPVKRKARNPEGLPTPLS